MNASIYNFFIILFYNRGFHPRALRSMLGEPSKKNYLFKKIGHIFKYNESEIYRSISSLTFRERNTFSNGFSMECKMRILFLVFKFLVQVSVK